MINNLELWISPNYARICCLSIAQHHLFLWHYLEESASSSSLTSHSHALKLDLAYSLSLVGEITTRSSVMLQVQLGSLYILMFFERQLVFHIVFQFLPTFKIMNGQQFKCYLLASSFFQHSIYQTVTGSPEQQLNYRITFFSSRKIIQQSFYWTLRKVQSFMWLMFKTIYIYTNIFKPKSYNELH